MTPTPPSVPITVPGFVVPDADLPDRPPFAHAGNYDAALHLLSVIQEESYDQLDGTGEGGHPVHLARVCCRSTPPKATSAWTTTLWAC